MKYSTAHIVAEFGPFPGVEAVAGVTFDGSRVWFASGDRLTALDPGTGATGRSIEVPARAGTAFDGTHLFQIADDRIQRIDPDSGRVLATIPVPDGAGASGLAWSDGMLWVARYKERKVHQVDPADGAIVRTIATQRYVTGVTWLQDEFWYGTWEDDTSDLRRADPVTGEVLETIALPAGTGVSGLESDGRDRFFCGGGPSGKLRVVKRA